MFKEFKEEEKGFFMIIFFGWKALSKEYWLESLVMRRMKKLTRASVMRVTFVALVVPMKELKRKSIANTGFGGRRRKRRSNCKMPMPEGILGYWKVHWRR